MDIQLEKSTIAKLMERSFQLYGDESAVAFVGEAPLSYRQLGQKVAETVSMLYHNGIHHGDKIALLMGMFFSSAAPERPND